MQRKILVAALAVGVLSANVAQAEGPLMVRARAVFLDFKNGQNDLAAKVEADNRWIPEVDISYFFTPNFATELVLTYPQNIDIKVNGDKQGTIKALPPSLMFQYHVTELGAFKPYVGLGLNYTIFTKTRNILGGAASVDGSSWGLAAQVGFDYMLTKNVALNLDVKYIQMDTDVKVGGNKIGTLDLNPITAGVGIGYRF
ncbi:OmpW/AlkL family protein [Dechloromonas denitrificans]|uniref:OmpW/AlkL family protein n=1 Tax=Dechloromonas denitrificans TaxID=281362 RepID=UPI001CF8AADC|nr:OmpW family outer membrane protein [Dechloromonas denitrificans]UCV04735.1 OmpW family protein [Dechloromonas denitrificans]